MSTDLVPNQPLALVVGDKELVVNPGTGEALDKDAPAASLAEFVEAVRDWEGHARQAKQLVSDWMHERFDRDRQWSTRDGDYEIKGQSDSDVTEWNVDALIGVLTALVAKGHISQEAMDAAIKYEPKIQKRGLEALRKNSSLAELIDACGESHPPANRRLTISRKRT